MAQFIAMHELIPHSGWKARYQASLDPKCPLYLDRGAPENGAYHRMYDFVIHPEWDAIGCETLYIKLLFVDYDQGYAVIELLGEWNDAVHNDVMEVKRRLADPLNLQGIDKFLLMADNLLNFHGGEEDYYSEWAEDCEAGWIVMLNARDHVIQDLRAARLSSYLWAGERYRFAAWRAQDPLALCQAVDLLIQKQLGA
ncbi:hypothetical protein N9N00_01500 [Schleiferiaceae bacterium]|nr:hypothetical protein [Schleiferiaceae bacterium]